MLLILYRKRNETDLISTSALRILHSVLLNSTSYGGDVEGA